MKKGIIYIACLLLILGCFSGVVSGAPKTTLVFQGWIGVFEYTKPAWDYMKDTFIKYVGVPYEQSREQMIIKAAGGNAPDITQFVAQWVPSVASMGALEPLDRYFSKEELEDIPLGVRESSMINGKLYSAPWNPGAIVLVRNKNLMKKAGFNPNEPPETWDELTDIIRGIGRLGSTEEGEKVYGVVLRTSKDTNSAFWTFPVMWAFGGRFANDEGKIVFDSPETVDAFKWYQEMAKNEFTPVGLHITEVRSVFALNRGGFIFEGPWTQGTINSASGGKMKLYKDYDVSLMPKGKDGISHAIGNHHVLILSKQCKNKDLAVKFIKHIIGNKDVVTNYYKISGGQTTTPFLSLLTSPPFSESPYVQVFVEQLKTANAAPFKNPLWDAALEFVAVCMQKSIMGEDVIEAVREAAASIRTLLGQ